MKNMSKAFLIFMLLLAGSNNADAEFQPRVFLPEADFYMEDVYISPDTAVPIKKVTATKPTLMQPTQIKQLHVNPQLVTKPAQTNNTVAVAQLKKDTALVRILYEGFKPKIKNRTDQIKVKKIIDSLVAVKDDSKNTGNTTGLTEADIIRILDSLIKANNIDTKKAVIDTPVVKPFADTVIVPKQATGRGSSFIEKYWWVLVLGVLLLGAIFFIVMKKKRSVATNITDSRIFFSYAWDQDEALIIQLYNSLKKDGFNVIKDKENMGYKGVISKFMNDIGAADFVVVAISDKYLRSKFCMYELYEIYKNSGMNSDKFSKKLFPIRIDESLNLGDPDVVNGYARYWKEQEDNWVKRMRDDSESITEEQARQYQFIKRLVNDVNNILSCLADINSLNITALKGNDFADVKKALRDAM